jgi:hypothetical protein
MKDMEDKWLRHEILAQLLMRASCVCGVTLTSLAVNGAAADAGSVLRIIVSPIRPQRGAGGRSPMKRGCYQLKT